MAFSNPADRSEASDGQPTSADIPASGTLQRRQRQKAERKPPFKVVPLVDDFAPGVDPDNLEDILNDMDVAAYLEQERGSRERRQ